MSEIRYIISDASRRVSVESHVLRYWEEELGLDILRNEMGHRYYREQDITLLKAVKRLKDQGFQLKAIKMLLPDINKIDALDPHSILLLREELNERVIDYEDHTDMFREREDAVVASNTNDEEMQTSSIEHLNSTNDKMNQFKLIMNDLILNAIRENSEIISKDISNAVTSNVIKEMDYLFRLKEEREEERYKKFDETLRSYQVLRQESALTNENTKKKRKLFGRKEKHSF